MKLYADYIKETSGVELFHSDDYFFTYKVYDNRIYLENVFIVPEKRGKKKSYEVIKEMENMAKELNKQYVTSSINKNCDEIVYKRSSKILKDNDFLKYDEDDNLIYYSKEIL